MSTKTTTALGSSSLSSKNAKPAEPVPQPISSISRRRRAEGAQGGVGAASHPPARYEASTDRVWSASSLIVVCQKMGKPRRFSARKWVNSHTNSARASGVDRTNWSQSRLSDCSDTPSWLGYMASLRSRENSRAVGTAHDMERSRPSTRATLRRRQRSSARRSRSWASSPGSFRRGT